MIPAIVLPISLINLWPMGPHEPKQSVTQPKKVPTKHFFDLKPKIFLTAVNF